MSRSLRNTFAAALSVTVLLSPTASYAHGGAEPLDEETTSSIMQTGSANALLGPSLLISGIVAGTLAAVLLLRRRPKPTTPEAEPVEPSDRNE